MSKDKKKKHQKELERRLRQRPQQSAPNVIAAAQLLSDPDRFAAALRHFSELSLLTPGLAGFRLPRGPLLTAFVETLAPEAGTIAERRRAVRAALLPRLATPELLEELQAAIQRAKKDVKDEAHLMALFAAQALATSCSEEGGAPGHVFWELPFDISVTDLLLSGDLMVEVMLRALTPSEEEVARTFARALVQGDVSRDLDAMGVKEHDPSKLAARYVAAVRDREPYHLQLDAVLHLLWAQQDQITKTDDVMRIGMTEERRAAMVEAGERAYREDITDQVKDDLLRWSRGRLEQLRDSPADVAEVAKDAIEHERLRAAALHLALRTIPREQDALLRSIHAQSLIFARRRASSLEVPFVHEISARPDDLFTLDQFEAFLTERGDVQRARRVRRYRDFVKRERDRAAPAAPAPSEAPAPTPDAEAGA